MFNKGVVSIRSFRRCKFLYAAAFLLLAVCLVSFPVYAADGITVVVNGKTVGWEDMGPRFSKGRVTVPVAGLGQALGARTVWDPATQDVFIYLYDRYVWLQITNPTLYYGTYAIDGLGVTRLTSVEAMPLDVRPTIDKGRAIAPLGPVITALGGEATWDGDTRTAAITGPLYAPAPYYADVRATAYAAGNAQPENADAEATDVPEVKGYLQIIDAAQAQAKYEADEPMILVCYHSGSSAAAQQDTDVQRDTAPLRETLRAAADLQIRIYTLDQDDPLNENALPFYEQQGDSDVLTVYFVAGYDRVESLVSPDYAAAYQAMVAYWETE